MTIPQPGRGFEWEAGTQGRVLRCLPLWSVAPHGFTTRDLTLGDDGTGWDVLAALVGSPAGQLVRVRQVHGTGVHEADPARAVPSADDRPEADAVLSRSPTRAVAVQVADCVPLLLADPRSGAVAAVHAGWRGTAAGIVGAAVRALDDREVQPANLVAALGPSIGPCCYEVGHEVRDAFRRAGWPEERLQRWFTGPGARLRLDLWRATCDQLVAAGVRPDRVHVAGLCTATHNDLFFSYRADGPGTGRLAAVIRPAPNPGPADGTTTV